MERLDRWKHKEKYELDNRRLKIHAAIFMLAYVSILALVGWGFYLSVFTDSPITLEEVYSNHQVVFVMPGILFVSFMVHILWFHNRWKQDKVYKSKVGKLPVNSKITIDYTGKRPSIRFAYPKKNTASQVTNSAPTIYAAALLSVLTTSMLAYGLTYLDNFSTMNPESCIVYSQGYQSNVTNFSMVNGFRFDCVIEGEHVNMTAEYMPGKWFGYQKPEFGYKSGFFDIPVFACLFVLYFIWKIVIRLIFEHTNWGHKNFPEFNKKLADSRFSCTFKPSDVKNNQCEIPLFQNIYMDYDFTGEMGKYLSKVQIINHPFNKLVRKGRRKKVLKDTDVYHWKAVFTFSQAPKNGKGEVRWT